MDKLSYAQRAVDSCVKKFRNGIYSSRAVKNILKRDDVDVKEIEPFMKDKGTELRTVAMEIVIRKGDRKKAIEVIKNETSRTVIQKILLVLSDELIGDDIDELSKLASSENSIIREEAISLFRKTGRDDCLLPLLLSGGDDVVDRIRKYMEEDDE